MSTQSSFFHEKQALADLRRSMYRSMATGGFVAIAIWIIGHALAPSLGGRWNSHLGGGLLSVLIFFAAAACASSVLAVRKAWLDRKNLAAEARWKLGLPIEEMEAGPMRDVARVSAKSVEELGEAAAVAHLGRPLRPDEVIYPVVNTSNGRFSKFWSQKFWLAQPWGWASYLYVVGKDTKFAFRIDVDDNADECGSPEERRLIARSGEIHEATWELAYPD